MNTNNNNKKNTKFNKKEYIKNKIDNTPEHIKNLVLLVKNNAEIRRYTALGIINKLKQKKLIAQDAKVFIQFYFNKYSIIVNGLKQEYTYNNTLFITCLAAAFPSFAHNANKVIDEFITKENQTLNESDIEEIVEIVKDNTSSPVEETSTKEE